MLIRLLLVLLCLAAVGGGTWWILEGGELGATTVSADTHFDDEGDDEDDEEREVAVPLDQLPDGVLAAAQAALPGVAFESASTELEDGERLYELQGRGADGRVEIELGADGTVLEIESGDDEVDDD